MGSSSKEIGSTVLMHYDHEEDILYFAFKKGKAHEVIEGSDGQSIIELDSNGNVIGLELWNAKERKILETLKSIVKER